MKLELNIEDDKELRDYIKNLVRGQVQSLTREDVREVLQNLFGQKFEGLNLQEILKEVATQQIKEIFASGMKTGYGYSGTLEGYVKQQVDGAIQENLKEKLKQIIIQVVKGGT